MQELKFSEAPKDQVIESLMTGVGEKFQWAKLQLSRLKAIRSTLLRNDFLEDGSGSRQLHLTFTKRSLIRSHGLMRPPRKSISIHSAGSFTPKSHCRWMHSLKL